MTDVLNNKSLRDYQGRLISLGKILSDDGLTATVYHSKIGERDVAVKVLRPNSSRIIREHFSGERKNMKDLREAWNRVYPNDPNIVPEVFTHTDDELTPFIAMEFVHGSPIDKLLSAGTQFTEQQALSLMIQFVKLLHVLHKETNQTYADLKFENLMVLENSDLSGLKVIDWNILDKYSVENEQRDLFLASFYLYQILTNTIPPRRGIKIYGRIDHDEKFSQLSKAMQITLRKLLNNNLDIRPSSAMDWLEEVSNMNTVWSMPVSKVVNEIQMSLEILYGNKDGFSLQELSEIYQTLRDQIELLHYREVPLEYTVKLREWESQLDEVRIESRMDNGKTNLKAGSFDAALNSFKQGASLDLMERENYLRWYWFTEGAVRVGRGFFVDRRDSLLDIIQQHLIGDYRRVISGFEQLPLEMLPSNELPAAWKALCDEARVYTLVQDSEMAMDQKRFSEAVLLLKEAVAIFDNLPAEPETDWVEYIGDLHFLLEESLRTQQTEGAYHQLLVEAQHKHETGQYHEAINQLRAATSLLPDKSEEVSTLWINWAKEELVKGTPAGHLYTDQGALTAFIRDSIYSLYHFSTVIREIDQQVKIQEYGNAVNKLHKLIANHPEGQGLFAYFEIQKNFKAILSGSIETNDAASGVALVHLAETTKNEWAIETCKTYLSHLVKNQMCLITSLANENNLQTSRKAMQQFEWLRTITEPYSQFLQPYQEQIEQIQIWYESYEQECKKNEQKIQQLKDSLAQYEKQLSDIKSFEQNSNHFMANALPSVQRNFQLQMLPEINREYVKLVCDALIASYELKALLNRIDPDFAQQKINYFHSLIGYKPEDYDTVFQILSSESEGASLERFGELVFLRADAAFEAGAPAEAIHSIGFLGNERDLKPEAKMLLHKAQKAIMLGNLSSEEEFEAFNPEDYPLPALYWNPPLPVRDYYHQKSQKLCNQILSMRYDQPGFSKQLKQLIDVHKKYVAVLEAAGDASTSSRTSSLSDVVNKTISASSGRHKATDLRALILRTIADLPDGAYTTGMIEDLLRRQKQTAGDDNSAKKPSAWLAWTGLALALLALFLIIFVSNGNNGESRQIVVDTHATEIAYAAALESCEHEVTVECPACDCPVPMPTPTLLPVIVPTPTSIFDVSDQKFSSQPWIYPNKDIRFIITDPVFPSAETSGMESFSGIGYANDTHILVGSGVSVGSVAAQWILDQKILEAGFYEFYISDPITLSATHFFVPSYKVIQDSELTPVVGDGSVKFLPSTKQTANEWRSIGVYWLEADKMVSVSFLFDDVTLAASEALPFDAIMVAKVPAPDTSLPLINDLINVKQHKVLYWVDDSDTTRTGEGWYTGPEELLEKLQTTWMGASYLRLTAESDPVTVTWEFSDTIRGIANVYQPGVHISTRLDVPATFELFLNDKSTGEVLTIYPEDGYGGTFQYFNSIVLGTNNEYNVKIVMTAGWPDEVREGVTEHTVGIDVAILNVLPRIIEQ